MQGCQTIAIPQGKAPTEVIRGTRHELAPVLQKARDRIANTQSTSKDNAGHRVKTHFKFRNDTEVSATTTKCPEEIAIFLGVCPQNGTVRSNDSEALDVIAGQTVRPAQPTRSSSQDKPAGAGMRNHTSGKREAYLLGCRINGPQEAAATELCRPRVLIDMNVAKSGEIDHQAIVASARTGQAVSAAANSGCYLRFPSDTQAGLNVDNVVAAG